VLGIVHGELQSRVVPLSNEDVQRLNDEFNAVVARSNAELIAAEDARRAALMDLPAARAALEKFDQAITRAQAVAVAAQREADAARERATEKAAELRAAEENAAHATFLANHAETIRVAAHTRADEECARRIDEVGKRIPPVSGTVLDAERKRAFHARDAAHKAADEACELALQKGRDALGAAHQAAFTKFADSADTIAREHQDAIAAIERTLQASFAAANDAFALAMSAVPAAADIERDYARTRQGIEQRAEAQKQDIFRQLRGDLPT
jgi:hypothetical protein